MIAENSGTRESLSRQYVNNDKHRFGKFFSSLINMYQTNDGFVCSACTLSFVMQSRQNMFGIGFIKSKWNSSFTFAFLLENFVFFIKMFFLGVFFFHYFFKSFSDILSFYWWMWKRQISCSALNRQTPSNNAHPFWYASIDKLP